MGRGKILKRAATAALITLSMAGVARASGGGDLSPWYLDEYGGDAADRARLYEGHLGIVMATSPRPQLYIAWRLLHGQAVGPTAGAALSIPCCNVDDPLAPKSDVPKGPDAWLAARAAVAPPATTAGAAAPEPGFFQTDRPGPDYTSIPTCFDDAFETAAATLKDRAARYGAASPAVAAWLAGQDAVFKACHDTGVTLPPLPAGAPAWLKADRDYQTAALAIYDDRQLDAAKAFAAIARDAGSPWRPLAPYLQARALVKEAVRRPNPAAFAAARAAIDALEKRPAGTYGQGKIRDMRRILAFRDQPAALLAQLQKELDAAKPAPDIAVMFRDYSDLSDKAAQAPEMMDWMAVMAAKGSPSDAAGFETARTTGLTHAQARWSAMHDAAWLIAALSLADPGDAAAPALIAAAGAVPTSSPAWLTAQYHLHRLRLAGGDAGPLRASLDAILARRDLSASDRNIFTAQRLAASDTAEDFVRYALRRRICDDDKAAPCVRDAWITDGFQPSGVYDGEGAAGTVGLGEDARAIIDRMALEPRMALVAANGLPEKLRLDIALTNYARAVQLQRDGAIDAMAVALTGLLPQVKADWQRIAATPPGPDKRFAEAFVMAKIPGLRVDLVRYERPEGTVDEFQREWTDWIILPKGQASGASPPPLSAYQEGGVVRFPGPQETPGADSHADLACLGECGVGATPLRLPTFVAAGARLAAAERSAFYDATPTEAERMAAYAATSGPGPHAPAPNRTLPPGASALWDEMLAYVAAHPADPRAPEALYWLVHVGHYGGSHNHSGKRAFQLLKSRYPESSWAKKTRYYYD